MHDDRACSHDVKGEIMGGVTDEFRILALDH